MSGNVTKIRVLVGEGEDAQVMTFKGRQAWCLHTLIQVGAKGFTTVERPAPRTSDYVHRLRGAGLAISTELEEHFGAYAGRHARYRLVSPVKVIEEGRE